MAKSNLRMSRGRRISSLFFILPFSFTKRFRLATYTDDDAEETVEIQAGKAPVDIEIFAISHFYV